MPRGIQVAIAPTNILASWIAEFSQVVVATKGAKSFPVHITLRVAHEAVTWQRVRNIHKLDTRSVAPFRLKFLDLGEKSTALMANIVLTTPQSYVNRLSKVLKGYQKGYEFDIAACYVDECHKFRGIDSGFSSTLSKLIAAYRPTVPSIRAQPGKGVQMISGFMRTPSPENGNILMMTMSGSQRGRGTGPSQTS
jgi:hypothetical protein